MTVKHYPLDLIDANPFQLRDREDPEHIRDLADSILAQGMQQTPAGRKHPDDPARIQLSFGGSRLAAFRRLHAEGRAGFDSMPVDVRKFTDAQLFTAGLAENLARKDLSPIEEAQAMRQALDHFGMTRAEVAELFAIQPGSVSNKLSLLELPADIQDFVGDGTMPERTARTFLHLARLKPQAAIQVANDLAGAGELDEERVGSAVGQEMRVAAKELMRPWDHGRVNGSWWRIEEDFKGPLAVTTEQAKAAVEDLADKKGNLSPAGWKETPLTVGRAGAAVLKLLEQGLTPTELIELHGWPAPAVERIAHLRRPPRCTACEYHSVVGGDHFCAFASCMAVKKAATRVKALAAAGRKKELRGIPEYDRKTDGPHLPAPEGSHYYGYGKIQDSITTRFQEALAEEPRNPDLRLRLTSPNHRDYKFTGSQFVELTAVGKLREQIEKAVNRSKSRQDSTTSGYAEQNEQRRRNEQVSNRVIEAAAPLLAPAVRDLKGRTAELVVYVLSPHDVDIDKFGEQELWEGWNEWSPRQRNAECQRYLGWRLASQADAGYPWGRNPKETVASIAALAAKLGIELLAGWADDALKDPESEETT
jgi:ParB/RepB/Spo0J family partition protein